MELKRRFKLRKYERLLKSSEYEAAFKNGKFLRSPYFIMIINKNKKAFNRLGIVIQRKTFNSSVARNKAKRRIREMFRLNKWNIDGGYDIVIQPLPKILKADFKQLCSEFLRLFDSFKNISQN